MQALLGLLAILTLLYLIASILVFVVAIEELNEAADLPGLRMDKQRRLWLTVLACTIGLTWPLALVAHVVATLRKIHSKE